MLKGRHGVLRSDAWFSNISLFSFIEVFLNFLKYLRRVLFPTNVILALIGLVFDLCQDFNCLITGSRFWCFCYNSSVIFSVFGKKMFSTSIFDRGFVSRRSWRLKTWFSVYFESLFGGPDKFISSVRFPFSIKGNRSCLYDCCLIGFCWVLFLIHGRSTS